PDVQDEQTEVLEPEGAAAPTPATTLRISGRSNKGQPPERYVAMKAKTVQQRVVMHSGGAVQIPKTWRDVLLHPESANFKAAMVEEKNSIFEMGVLEPVSDYNKKPIPTMVVYDVKVKADGGFDRYKARIVVKGYAQRVGIDFDDTWAPVSKLESVRSFLATAATRNWTAFLNAELTEEIYIRLPEEVDGGTQVYRLRKALYGLKQASRAWYEKLKDMMTSLGWTASDADPAFFWRETTAAGYEGVCCHVDDMLIGSTVLANVIELKQQLGSMVEIKDLGVASYYLAMEVQQRSDKLLLTQQKYISEILERFQVPQFEKKHTPMDTRQLSAEDGDLLDDQSTAKYREMTGCLMYVCRGTRPDIAYSVGVLARYMKQPRTLHLKAAMDILKYLAATKLMGIEYGGQRDTFVGYSDSDLGGCRDDSRSTTGFAFMLNGGAVSWRSRLQPTIADSSCEAEFMAAAEAIKEALWFKKLLPNLGVIDEDEAVMIMCDNESAEAVLRSPRINEVSKHISRKWNFAKESVALNEVKIEHV
ncbi:hypothetical protein CEUSTIGMA_g14033.t1, partial [Chlamydomonas eustigma]